MIIMPNVYAATNGKKIAKKTSQPKETQTEEIYTALYPLNKQISALSELYEEIYPEEEEISKQSDPLANLYFALRKLRNNMAIELNKREPSDPLYKNYQKKAEQTAKMIQAILSADQKNESEPFIINDDVPLLQDQNAKIELIKQWEQECREDVEFWDKCKDSVVALTFAAGFVLVSMTLFGITGAFLGIILGSPAAGPAGASIGGMTGFCIGLLMGLTVGLYNGPAFGASLVEGRFPPIFSPLEMIINILSQKEGGVFGSLNTRCRDVYLFWERPDELNREVENVGKAAKAAAALPVLKR